MSSGFLADLADSAIGRVDAKEGLKSNLARIQNDLDSIAAGASGRRQHARLRSFGPGLRAAYEDRLQLRAEMYKNSLLALSTRYANLYLLDIQDVRVYHELQRIVGSGPVPARDQRVYEFNQELTPAMDFGLLAPRRNCPKELFGATTVQTLRTLILPCLVWVRNMADLMYRNITRMQIARFTAGSLSVIVLPRADSPVVEMRTIKIEDVQRMVQLLDIGTSELHSNGLSSTFGSTLANVRDCCHKIMKSLTPSSVSLTSHLHALNEYADEATGLTAGNGASQATIVHFFMDLTLCRSTIERLDLVVLSNEGAHTADLESSFNLQSKGLISFFDWEKSAQNPLRVPFAHCLRRLSLKCLAGLLGHREIWVICDSETIVEQDVYLLTDIETFAETWGPVWKVAHPRQPDVFLKYNVGEGSIVPWPVGPGLHPALAENQRLCHWQSNMDLTNMHGKRLADQHCQYFAHE